MSFKYFRLNAGENMVIGRDIIHIVYLIKGKLSVTGEEMEIYTVSENRFIVVSQTEQYTLTALEDSEFISQDMCYPYYVCEQVNFEGTYLKHMEEIRYSYKFDSLDTREPLQTTIRSVALLIKDGVLCNHMIHVKMQEVFILYKHYYNVEELTRLFFPIFNKRMEFYIKVQAAAFRASTVKELAEMSGYGLSNFKIKFKSYFNTSPRDWMIDRKVDMLRYSLGDKTKPLKVIVDEFGFSDQSHLNNFCKRHMGGTALQVRNKMLGE